MRYVCMMLACLLMVGCQEEEKWGIGDKTGFLVSLDDVSVEVTTRAASEDFNLVVTKEGITEPVKETALTAGSSTFVEVSEGIYDIKATSKKEIKGVAWDPYYVADTTEVEITDKDTPKTIPLTAKYGCALVSVTFPEGLNEIFKEYHVTVAANSSSLKLTSSKNQAYVEPGTKVSLSFGGTKLNGDKVENKPLKHDDLPETFDAADYYKITLMMGDGLTMDISKVEEKTVDITEEIPLDWLPKPKVEAEGFTGNTLTFVETESKPAKLNLNLSHALQDIKFKFNFEDEQFAESLQADKEYSLSTDKAAIESALGITLPEVGAETGSLDFSPLVAKLQTNAGTTTNNTVEIDVKANNRWSSEVKEGDKAPNLKYTFTCNKPEFSVAVQEGNVWTKTFTIDEPTVTAGNAEVLKGKLVYQYREKGANDDAWQKCSNGLEQVFSTQPNKKEYEVRAFYREGIVSEVVDVELESPEQLPNSNMDEWNYETYTGDRFSFNPWADNGTPFWDTNNDYTTRHKNNSSSVTMANYNGFHAVSYVQGRGGNGLAAELRSTANGRGNTRVDFIIHTHNELDINKVAGKLFTGTANVEMTGNDINGDDTYTEEKNASFPSRPTALTFYYKYAPYNSDTWSVHIELLDENKNVIVQNDKTSSEVKSDWTQASVSLDYVDGTTYAKCKYIYVIFKSTTNEGANMPYREITQTFYVLENGALSSKTYEPAYVGSVLTIDDIELIYDK